MPATRKCCSVPASSFDWARTVDSVWFPRCSPTRVDFQAGSAVIECASQPEHAHLAFTFQKATVSILKDGVYRLDSDPGQLEVYAGQARVLQGEQTQTVGKDRRLVLDGVSAPGR